MRGKTLLGEIRDLLPVDSLSHRDGVFTAREGFFYTHGKTSLDLVALVTQTLEEHGFSVEVDDSGEVWKDFRGGAPVGRSSHWFVKFKIIGRRPR